MSVKQLLIGVLGAVLGGGAVALAVHGRSRDEMHGPVQRQPKVRIVGVSYPERVVHGTTARSAEAFVGGRDLPASERQRTFSEFGDDVLYVSEKTAPHQALMFASHGGKGHGGRVMVELALRGGAQILDLASEMQRRSAIGNDLPLAIKGRPSVTDDMAAWLNETRLRHGRAAKPHEEALKYVDPTHPEFYSHEYPALLASYTRDRGYAGLRFTDETVLVRRDVIVGARKMKKAEVDALRQVPRRMPGTAHGALYTRDFEADIGHV